MRYFIIRYGLLLFVSFLSFNLYAWPVFLPPTKDFLLQNHLIDTQDCPSGYGKIIKTKSINIHDSLCTTYCPDNWLFVASADDQCHQLTNEFEFQGYTITHYNDRNGSTLYSVVTAAFGQKDAPQAIFSYSFTSPREHWYCIVANTDLHTITCANDT